MRPPPKKKILNDDGDKNDIVDFQEKRDPTNALGRPWWGEMVAGRLGINTIAGAIITGAVGAIIFGTAGYFGADWIADQIDEN